MFELLRKNQSELKVLMDIRDPAIHEYEDRKNYDIALSKCFAGWLLMFASIILMLLKLISALLIYGITSFDLSQVPAAFVNNIPFDFGTFYIAAMLFIGACLLFTSMAEEMILRKQIVIYDDQSSKKE